MVDEPKTRRGHNRGGKYKGSGYYIEAVSLGYTTNKAGKRVRARKYFYGKSRKEAETKKNTWRREREREDQLRKRGIDVDHHRMPFARFAGEWLATSVTGQLKESTERGYRHVINAHLLPAFGDVPINEIGTQAIERMLRGKQGTHKPTTLKTVLTVFRTILNTAVRWRYIERNPATDVRYDFSTDANTRQHITRDQEQALFDLEMKPWERNLYRIAIETGMRQGELLALQWSDIDLERGVLFVTRSLTRVATAYDDDGNKTRTSLQFTTPKTKAGIRIIPFPESVRSALASQRAYVDELKAKAATWNDLDLVFPARNGNPLDPSGVGKRFRTRRVAAGIPEAVFHSFRHTATSRMMMDNIAHPIAMALLGHKNIDTTMLYTHTNEDDLISAMKAYFDAKKGDADA